MQTQVSHTDVDTEKRPVKKPDRQTDISTEGKTPSHAGRHQTCVKVSQVAASVFKLEFRALAISNNIFLKLKALSGRKRSCKLKNV